MPTLRRAAGALLTVAVALLLAHHTLLFSGFTRVQGDPGDVRFVHYCIEHTWAWLGGHPLHHRFWDLPAFFPVHAIGAYSDVLLGVAPPYWLARTLGAGPDRAYVWWLLATSALNALVARWFLRSALGVGPLAASAGAVLIAAGAPRVHAVNHPQLVAAYWALLVLGLLTIALRSRGTWKARLAWVGASGAFGLQAWSSYYYAWFLALALGLALLGALIDAELRARLATAVAVDRWAIAVSLGVFLLLVVPLGRTYWDVSRTVGLRPLASILLPHGQSWLYIGPDSWWYAPLARLPGFERLPVPGEQQLGVGALTTVVALVGLWRARGRPVVALILGTGVALVLLSTQWGRGSSAWHWLHTWVPGAAGIRAVSRLGILVLIAWAAGLSLAIDRLGERSHLAAALLALACVLEQGVSFASFAPAEQAARVRNLAAAIGPDCTAFVFTPDDDGSPAWRSQVDAMWAADVSGVPTLNGYSGNYPPRWPLDDCLVRGPKDQARLSSAVEAWVRETGMRGRLCQLGGRPVRVVNSRREAP
jgi:hypothetical protein